MSKFMFVIFFLAFPLFANTTVGIPTVNMTETLKLMSEQNDNKYANFLLGVMYLNGDQEVKQDIRKAIEHFEKDADNLSYASYMLGLIAAKGYGKVAPDYNKAINYFIKSYKLYSAPDNKEVGPVALAAIGNIYLNNLQKPKEALEFLLQASELRSMPNVDFVIALIYYTSEAPLKNDNLAEYYLNKAYNNATVEERKYMDNYIEGKQTTSKEGACIEY